MRLPISRPRIGGAQVEKSPGGSRLVHFRLSVVNSRLRRRRGPSLGRRPARARDAGTGRAGRDLGTGDREGLNRPRAALSRFVTSWAPSLRSRSHSIVTSRADIRRIKTRRQQDLRAPRNSTPPAPKTEHARNQVRISSADEAAPCGSEKVGRGSERGRTEATRPTVDAARHTTED